MGFLSHNSGSRHDRRSIKSSEDADDHLVSKTILSQKNGSLHWRPGPGKVGQKRRNMPSLLRHQQKKNKPKTKKILLHLNWKTCWIRRWFEQLSSSIGWRVIALQKSGARGTERVKKHCPEEAYLNKWAKRRQNNKIIARRSNLSAWGHKCLPPANCLPRDWVMLG